MKTKSTWWTASVGAFLGLLSLPALAQPPAPPTSVLGQVETVDAASRTIKMRAEDGAALSVTLAEKGTVVKVAPGEKSLQNAAPIEFGSITAGDRVLVRGGSRSDGSIAGALRVIVMAKTELAARNENEQRAWRERGVAGTLAASDPAKGEFTIRTGASPAVGQTPGASNTLVVDAKNATLHHYADTSIKFEDAKVATITQMEEGDQVRVLGTRSADGARLTAERVVFGHFKTMALAVEKVDTVAGVLSVKDLESNRKFAISVVAGGTIRRIPAEMGAMFGMMGAAGGARPGGRPEGGAERGTGGGAPGMGAPGGMGPRPAGRGADMVERMPTITLADLKKDDWIGAVVSKIDASGRAVAFNVLAGIEVFASRANRGGGVDVGMPAGLLDGALGVP